MTTLVVQTIFLRKVDKVAGQCTLPQTTLSDDENKSPHNDYWKLTRCSRSITHLTGSSTRKWPP